MKSGSLTRTVMASVLLATLGGCAQGPRQGEPITPEGSLQVMGPDLTFDLGAMDQDWTIVGDSDPERIGITERRGVPALGMTSGDESMLLVRHINAMALATPYLSWAWNMSDHGVGVHPVRLIVGFHGGRAPEPDKMLELKIIEGELPKHDRALALVWGSSALNRGTYRLSSDPDEAKAPLYTVRGGREMAGQWWLETVDLADLYAKAWPTDTMQDTQIVFIGVGAAPGSPGHRGRISGIMLSK